MRRLALPHPALAGEPGAVGLRRFDFELAAVGDEAELRAFSRQADMPGAIRFAFDRAPDYFAALRVEGRESAVLICRESSSGRLIGTGHRSFKPAWVNGRPAVMGYLSGLRLDRSVRSGHLLARGYAALRQRLAGGSERFCLTSIMEHNGPAKAVVASGRCGLPVYHDFGRFCCMALSLRGRNQSRPSSELLVRQATQADGTAVVEFLNREGPSRQFFPEYRLEDFGVPGGLLSHLAWKDVFLAFRASELIGVLAAWDQRAFRRWQVTGYAPWLRWLRLPLNLVAGLRGMPLLPRPGSSLNYFVLSLACIRENDPAVFKALLETILREKRTQFSFFIAGLHERDPLLPELLAQPHVPLTSRLYVVAWPESAEAVQRLDRDRVPYLELGGL